MQRLCPIQYFMYVFCDNHVSFLHDPASVLTQRETEPDVGMTINCRKAAPPK